MPSSLCCISSIKRSVAESQLVGLTSQQFRSTMFRWYWYDSFLYLSFLIIALDWSSTSDTSITENPTYIPPQLLDSTCTAPLEQCSGKDTSSVSAPPSSQKEVSNAPVAAANGRQAAPSLLSSLNDHHTERRDLIQTGVYDRLERQEISSHSGNIYSTTRTSRKSKIASGKNLPYESVPLLSTTDTSGDRKWMVKMNATIQREWHQLD